MVNFVDIDLMVDNPASLNLKTKQTGYCNRSIPLTSWLLDVAAALAELLANTS